MKFDLCKTYSLVTQGGCCRLNTTIVYSLLLCSNRFVSNLYTVSCIAAMMAQTDLFCTFDSLTEFCCGFILLRWKHQFAVSALPASTVGSALRLRVGTRRRQLRVEPVTD